VTSHFWLIVIMVAHLVLIFRNCCENINQAGQVSEKVTLQLCDLVGLLDQAGQELVLLVHQEDRDRDLGQIATSFMTTSPKSYTVWQKMLFVVKRASFLERVVIRSGC
jgi:hypothetical protein